MFQGRMTIKPIGAIAFAAVVIVALPSNSLAFDTAVIDWAIKELCSHITGDLGGMLVSVAALGAIVAAAMGSYRVFYSAIMTAVGAFAISSIVSLYFEDAAGQCSGGGGAAGGRAAINVDATLAPVNQKANAPLVGETGLGD